MNRQGFTLLLVLLAVVALELLTLSSLALSTHEQVVANAQVRTATARRGADAALHNLVWTAPAFVDSIAIGELRTVRDSGTTRLEVERLSWGTYLLTAREQAGSFTHQRSMLLRRLNAERAFHEFNEALVSAGPLDLSHVTLSIDDAAVCVLPFAPERAARRITVAHPEFVGLLEGAVADSVHALSPAGYALGALRWSELAGIADSVVNGQLALPDTGELGPMRLIYAPDDLLVLGGTGRGLLLVHGNLQLRGVRWAGIVLAGGILDAEDVALEGSIRVQGRAASRILNSDLRYAQCAVAQVLLETRALRRVVRGGRRLLPTF